MNKAERRRQKGKIVGYYPGLLIRGNRKGHYTKKSILK